MIGYLLYMSGIFREYKEKRSMDLMRKYIKKLDNVRY